MIRIRCEDLTKRFDDRLVLDQINLEVPPAECLAIVGPSGAGKTTLLHLLAGLERVDGGCIRFDDRVVSSRRFHEPPQRRQVAIVFQERALWLHLTAREHFRLVTGNHHEGPQALERLGMSELLDHRPDQMSGGEAQRLAVALAIASKPRLLLLDEPRGPIDPDSLAHLDDLVDEFLRANGATCLLVTHDAREAARWAGRMALIERGKIQQTGLVEQLYREPANPAVARQTGEVTLLEATITSPRLAQTALGPLPIRSNVNLPDHATLALRPESWECDPNGPVAGVVSRAHFVDGRWLAKIRCDSTDIHVYLSTRPAPGDALRLRLVQPAWAIPPTT